ncbi:MAG: NADP-dependent isocitrate dehydrogenase [Planctomycetota bacterium]|jgi:isocitrate dehydrogenase|nr:NADP-dependent isocitrate dehydrogenase [Planctomycetota bacterium]
MSTESTIVYTYTDEAPMLATYSLLPIVRAFGKTAGVEFSLSDISLAGRIIAAFPDKLSETQRQEDALAKLGDLATTPNANIIKLPNISASLPQLSAAIAELQAQGYDIPNYPAEPSNAAEQETKARYAKILGSAVNPVLREGNSDRRVAGPVKAYAKKNPHSMGAWSTSSKTHVAHMESGDFFGSEKSIVVPAATEVAIELVTASGDTQVLKASTKLLAGEVFDAAVMSKKALRSFLAEQIADAKAQDVLFSLHLKATMMKVSDPIMFGHGVTVFFKDLFDKHAATFERIGVTPNNGLGDLEGRLSQLSADERAAIEADLKACYEAGPAMAMVDSDRGITNLHVPSDIIIDASMPAMIRTSGQMWGPDGKQQDTKAVIPDRSYAGVYRETIDFCRAHGAFDPSTMGNVANVGLMAKKAEEYGSHDKTFEIPADGTVRVVDSAGTVLLEHAVEAGDIWRACQTKDEAIRDWVKLAVSRARATGAPAVFWLDKTRAHDAQLITKINTYLPEHDTSGLDIRVLAPVEATRLSLERCKAGEDTISVTGNVLRDYLTDLFPILELGTSAKMLSIVPLLAGGGLYETGAGGSAPKHVQQFQKEYHSRWDSLGEFLAIGVSLEDLGGKTNNPTCLQLAETLNQAIGKHLDERKSPSRKCGELDNRGSHFYLALYWAEALAAKGVAGFGQLAKTLGDNEQSIVNELIAVQGSPIDIGGYYRPDCAKANAAMRPSATFNAVIDALG